MGRYQRIVLLLAVHVFEPVPLLLPSDLCAHQASLPSTLPCLPPPHRSTGTAELGRHSQPPTGSGELSISLCVSQQALLQARKPHDLE